jgi:tRNA nucleotidyltransferase (CCA-adding enzyme)
VKGNKRYASTVSLTGGLAKGTLLGKEDIDLTVETPDDQWESWNDLQKRLSTIKIYKPLSKIKEQDRKLQIQIRNLV